MANTYKNIVITPNTGSSTGDPTVVFSGGNTSVNTDITLRVYPDSNGTLSFEGAAGQLFSITNDLTNTIFSVNDVSGIPLIEVNVTSQQITFGEFYGNVGVGRSASTNSTYKLDVAGTINAANILVNGSPLTTSLTPANNYAGVMANSANGYASTIVDANLVTARAYTNTSTTAANNYAGVMANSGNSFTQTIVDANLVTARAYTNTSTTAANNYAGAMANSGNAFTQTIVDANLVTARAYTNTSTTAANNYAGVMANSANAYASSLGVNTSLAYTWSNTQTFSSNVFYRNTSNIVWITNAASSVSNVTLKNYPDSNGTLSFEGSAGQLFSITNDLTGSLFSVNDVSGIPLIEVNVTSQQITFGEFYGNVGIGRSASTGSTYKLDVAGTINAANILINGNSISVSLTPANNYAGVMANSANGYASTIVDANLIVARAYTNTSTTASNNYAGVMANSANGFASTIVDANLVTARAYTNTSTTAANNYAGVMANSSNAFASATFGTITNTTAAFAAANQAGVVANNANTFAGTTYVKKVGDTISGDLVVQGNLTTSGVVTYANTQTLLIGDSLITLNNDIPVAVAPSEDAGIEVKRGSSANVSLLWREGNDNWTLTNDGTTWYSIATNNDVTSANNYAGAMANSANAYASSLTPNLTPAFSAANQAGVIANAAFNKANTGGSVNVSTTGPTNNTNGTLWFNTELARLLIYYTDVDSSQWIEASPSQGSAAFGLANGAYITANAAYVVANASFDTANNRLANTNVVLAGNLTSTQGIADRVGDVRNLPIVNQTSSYTISLADNGEVVSITTGNVFVTANVFFPGNTVTVYNNSSANVTITQNTGVTLNWAGLSNTGNRILQQKGLATLVCVAANTFVLTGAGFVA